MTYTIINAQQKGGVGKTTDTVMEAIVAATIFNKKVLVIDTDLQGNATQFLSKTFGNPEIPNTLMACLEKEDLSLGIVNLSPKIDMIGCDYDMRNYTEFLDKKFKSLADKTFYLKKLLDKIKDSYDFIFIDVPPSTDIKVDNAMVCADYVIVIQETQQFSFDGSKRLILTYLQTLVNDFGDLINVQVAGVLPVLLQARRPLQQKIVDETIEYFGRDNVFNNIINNHARLEWYTAQGVQFEDYHDKRIFSLYADIFNELLKRIESFESTGDVEGFHYEHEFINGNRLTEKGKKLKLDGFTEKG
ncbi:MAG: ParA superfamily DNA segregation protein PrgP [Liquorilactobacillus hordei]|uniref:Rep63B n=1 Tax=Liquorilactobacillus hordei DSM 19519 TaxID=1423759 RepID=A0A0R1M668_9LACO|nr:MULTISPECIES: ParA superfamily DNA segregation protein PrgP [Lactobacillaceae]KRL03369.1 Rep63B [Liquorilactobacillus hordei DSM 19519]MCP9358446.1 AAA family ATPase [Liquorilactobacillus satsumensis]MCP9372400.1 AAA family ATPase [Liquorilactobacillus satsumensis]MDN2454058.1 AAA family ATPase [Lactobacillus sp. UCMA15818]QYH51160.1 AAA family ATPase [Liquorilactobacillus hordei DSM 19519]